MSAQHAGGGTAPSVGVTSSGDAVGPCPAGTPFSFELYPPRNEAAARALPRTIERLAAAGPRFISVTYGAGGSTRDTTVRITERIATETTLTPVGHLTAVNHSVAELRRVIGQYADAGIRNMLALRGDPPGNPQGEWVAHPQGFQHADELVRLIKGSGDFCVGVAAFPQLHPRSASVADDTRYFVRKCVAGAEFAITQMFFSAADYLALRDRIAASGCDVPIIPGIMPLTSISQIERFALLSGKDFPQTLADDLMAVADDADAVRAVGVHWATEQARDLLDNHVRGIHFYTLNHSQSTRDIYKALGAKDSSRLQT